MIKRFLIATGALLLLATITATILFTKPWDDLQSWRFFLTQPVVAWRADIFTNWGGDTAAGRAASINEAQGF